MIHVYFLQEDADFLKESIDEKEKLIVELTEQIESLQVEMENLSDFQVMSCKCSGSMINSRHTMLLQ